MKVFKQNKA